MVKAEYDKGWAWAVALAAMTINFIVAGLGRVSGIMFVAFIEAYGVGRREASLPLSVRSSMRNLMGPVVGILGQKYGARTVILMGGVLSTASTAACIFSTNMLWITILWGGISGMAAAFVTILPQVVIGQYFRKYKTTAAGMGFSGGCVGSILFPAIVEQMILSYGIGGTFLIIAGILSHIIPAAIILRDAPWHTAEKNQRSRGGKEIQSVRQGNELKKVPTSDTFVAMRSKDSVNKEFDPSPNVQFLRRNNETVLKMLLMKHPGHSGLDAECNNSTVVMQACLSDALEDIYCWLQQSTGKSKAYANFGFSKNNLLHERLQSDALSPKYRSFHLSKCSVEGNSGIAKTSSHLDVTTLSNEISSNFVLLKMKGLLRVAPSQVSGQFDEGARENVLKILSELRKVYNVSSRLNDGQKIDEILPQTEKKGDNKTESNSFSSHLKTTVRLFAKPTFLLLSACRAVHIVTFVPTITTIVDFGMDQGLLEEDGKFIIAALSAGDLVGRLCLGWVTDRGYMTMPKFMFTFMLILGANTVSLPLVHYKPALYSVIFSFGLLQGCLFVRHVVLVAKYFGKHEQSIAMGCINLFAGFLGFIFPMYIGYFRDTLGSYDYMFYLNGIIVASIGLIWIFEPVIAKCSGSVRKDENGV